MLLEAYLDESGRNGGVFAVGGYAFTPDQAREFCRDWREMLGGIQRFHATDLSNRRGEFEGFEDGDRMLRDAVRIIRDHTLATAVVVCESEDFEAAAPKKPSRRRKHRRRSPFAVCCHFCMYMLAEWMEETRREGDIAYFFEGGNQHQGEAHNLLQLAVGPKGWAERYHYKSHTFMFPKDAPPLQAADLLVWEYAKYYAETFKPPEQQKRKPRGSFVELMQRDPANIRARRLLSSQIQWLYEQLPELKEL